MFGAPTGWTESDGDRALEMKAKRRAWSSGIKVAAPYIGASCLAISPQTLDHNTGLEYSTGERVSDGQNVVPNSRLVISFVRWQHMPTVSDEDGSEMGSVDDELDQVLEEGDRDTEMSDDKDSLVLYTRLHVQIMFCSS